MQKLTTILTIVAIGIAATACGPEKPKRIDQMSNLTAADSLVYYYAQIKSHEYDKMAVKDTFYNSRAARIRYIEGINKGFELVSDEDDAYNQGLKDGIDLAIRDKRFQRSYNVKTDKKVLLQSMAYGILDNDTINPLNAQVNFYNAVHTLNKQLVQSELPEIRQQIAHEAQIRDMSKINDLLYKRIIEAGEGIKISEGADVDVHIRYSYHSGEDIGLPSPRVITVDSNLQPIEKDIFLSMREGEIASFATSAYELFGNRARTLGLHPDDIILASITVNTVTPADNDTKPELPADSTLNR